MPSREFLAAAAAYGGLVPATVAFALLLAGRLLARRFGDGAAHTGGALAAGGGFLAGAVALGLANWKPTAGADWLPGLAVVASAAGLIGLIPRVPRWFGLAAAVPVAALAAWLLVPDRPALAPVRTQYLVGTGVAILATWWLLDALVWRERGGWPLVLLAAVAMAASGVEERSGIAKFAQLAGVLAAVLGGGAVAAFRSSRPLARGVVPAVAVLLPGYLLQGYLGAELPSTSLLRRAFALSFLLVAFAPLGIGVGALPGARRWSAGWRGLLQAFAVLGTLAAAVTLATIANAEGEADTPGDDEPGSASVWAVPSRQ